MMKNLMRYAAALAILISAGNVRADQAINGVRSLSPVGEHSCLAVAMEVEPWLPVAGLRWFNNDGQTVFPRVLLIEGDGFASPRLVETSVVIDNVQGQDYGWSDLLFATPVVSSSGVIHAVFELPAYEERTGVGPGGGPGIGISSTRMALGSYLTTDGVEWMRVGPGVGFAVEPILTLGRGAAAPVALEFRGDAERDGWWTQVEAHAETEVALAGERSDVVASRSASMRIVPNPFNPRTEVRFELQSPSRVEVEIFNVRGQLVRTLVDEVMQSGSHSVVWNGKDDGRRPVASGIYLIRLKSPESVIQRRAVLLR